MAILSSRRASALAVILSLSACGGGGSSTPQPSPPPTGSVPAPPPPPATPAPPPAPTPPPTSAIVTYLHIFGVEPGDGFQPNGPPVQASDGSFYGTTRNGGVNTCRPILPTPCGVIFRVTPGGDETVLYTFGATSNDGYTPLSALIQGMDGALYGTTANGGTYGGGTVFRISLDGTYRSIYSFGGANGEGDTLPSALTLGKDGNLYGVTSSGGANHCPQIPRDGANCGTAFRLTPEGTLTTLASFGRTPTDGFQPNGPLLQASDGSFYGTTSMGGASGRGTIFKLRADGTMSTVFSFGATSSDPSDPQGSLVQGTDGALYGTTVNGGLGRGTVFRLDASGQVTVAYAFGRSDFSDGVGPSAFLAVGRDGHLYGTTRSGGLRQGGTAFRLTNAGMLTTLFAFGRDGQQSLPYDPEMGLIEGNDGALYGMTFYNEGLGGVGNRPGFGAMYKLTTR